MRVPLEKYTKPSSPGGVRIGRWMIRFAKPARRRGRASRGFTLIEALVALTVSAMTLGLLASAGFGLQKARQAETQAEAPVDLLVARRVLQDWGRAAAKSHPRTSGAFAAEADQLSLRTTQGTVMRFDIETEGGRSTLTATRAGVLRDVRLVPEGAPTSVLLQVPGRLRFAYLMHTGLRGQGRDWVYNVSDADGLPAAIRLEQGEHPLVTVPVAATAAGPCVVSYGMSENGVIECDLR